MDSLNVNGLRADAKRKDLFRYFKNRKLDMVLLQETHSTPEDETIWLREWGGRIIFAHGLSQSKGVAILIRRDVPVEVLEIKTVFQGRFVLLEVKISEFTFLLVNFYGPNEDDDVFFVKAFEIVEGKDNPNMILGGDFNVTLNPNLDTNCNSDHHKKKRMIINNFLEMKDLVDVWRVQNPDKYQYSWKRDKLALTSSRIDYFFVLKGLCNRLTRTEMWPGYKSDHWRLDLGFDFQSSPRGRGFWKFNSYYLKEKDFVEEMNKVIDEYLWEVKQDITPAQNWEYLKLRIATFCTEYTSRKATTRNRLIDKLENRLKILDRNLLTNPDQEKKKEIAVKIRKTEEFLINEHEEMAQKKADLFRAKWHNLGEKSNKFFFNLAKAKYNAKVISKIRNNAGEIIVEPKAVLKEQFLFYQKLFKEEKKDRSFPYVNSHGPKLSEEEKIEIDRPLEIGELSRAISDMENGKTPGCDGIPAEFYKMFWSRLKHILFQALSFALKTGTLHRSATRGIITLLPKKERDLLLCKSWRPLTLLNVDYKILSKALALRMKSKLDNLIHEDQTGFMAGRNINHNVRKIFDVIEVVEREKVQALLVSIDFDSCFDRISHFAIQQSLDFFNFGPQFQRNVQTLLNGAQACVLNNGHITDWLKVERSTRQGCCISPFLAICCLEVLAIQIRENAKIKGITVKEIIHKLIQFADDLNLLLEYDVESLEELARTFDLFEESTGFKINYNKTSVYRIGSLKNSNAKLYTTKELNWTNEPVRVLGVMVGCDQKGCTQINFEQIMSKVQNTCKLWENQNLSLMGKVLVVNTLIGSLFVHKLSTIRKLSKQQIDTVNRIINEFIWGKGKRAKMKISMLQNAKEFGGLKLLDIARKDIAFKAQWVANYKRFSKIRSLADYFLPFIGENFWSCNIHPTDVETLFQTESFWKDVASAWAQINWHTPVTTNQVKQQILWFNSHVKIDKNLLFDITVWNSGCRTVGNLLTEQGDKFLSYDQFINKFGNVMPWLQYYGLLGALPAPWKEMIRNPVIDHEIDAKYNPRYETLTPKISDIVYNYSISEKELARPVYNKWVSILEKENVRLSYDSFLNSFLNMKELTSSPKYLSFQYRLLHRKIFLNKILKKWKLSDTELCTWCNLEYETIEHFFYECTEVRDFWRRLRCWFECLTDTEVNLTFKDIIFNNCEVESDKTFLNTIILIAKQHLFSRKCQGITETGFYVLKDKLNDIAKSELHQAKNASTNKQKVFRKRWGPLLQ